MGRPREERKSTAHGVCDSRSHPVVAGRGATSAHAPLACGTSSSDTLPVAIGSRIPPALCEVEPSGDVGRERVAADV